MRLRRWGWGWGWSLAEAIQDSPLPFGISFSGVGRPLKAPCINFRNRCFVSLVERCSALIMRFPRFMPAFRTFKTDAGYIARILAGYGHLEFVVGGTIGNALASKRRKNPKRSYFHEHRSHYEKVGLQVLYMTKGAERRLKRAKAIARPAYELHGLKTEFSETFLDLTNVALCGTCLLTQSMISARPPCS
jgi:hypothetical protein